VFNYTATEKFAEHGFIVATDDNRVAPMRGGGVYDLGNDIAFFFGNLRGHTFGWHAGADDPVLDLCERLFGLVPRFRVKLFSPLIGRSGSRPFNVRRKAR